MKRNFLFGSLMTLFFFFGPYGMVFGDGGGREPPPYNPLQDPTISGAYLKGFFTAAHDKQSQGQNQHYNVHILLRWDMRQTQVRVRRGDKTDGWNSVNF